MIHSERDILYVSAYNLRVIYMKYRVFEKNKVILILTFVKYLFFAYLLFKVLNGNEIWYVFFCLCEISIGDSIIENLKIRNMIHSIYVLLIGMQMLFLIYARTFLTLVMVDNIASLEDISGNAQVYVIGFGLLFVVAFIPLHEIQKKEKAKTFLSMVLVIELGLTMVVGNTFSPVYSYMRLLNQGVEQKKLQRTVELGNDSKADFYQSGIGDYISKPDDLVTNPNIIIIFTEGLSQNVIDDEREIMPNVSAYQKKALNVENYYNHTFATYRGLNGQLYSGYQMENYDENRLVSLQEIFKSIGYDTTFINAEPNNGAFTAYLERMNFDHLESNVENATEGMINTVSDKMIYENLLSIMEQKENVGQPYLIAMYTFGTHASLDSVNEMYGDGKDAELNKFYNLDYQFGKFMENFENSEMAKDTVIIFTADHCTYEDEGFYKSFPNYKRESWGIDKIPFFIYYQGIQSETIDAGGRNSLDLAPTICDYFDVTAENYFLGVSVFTDIDSNYDTVFQQGQDYYSTRGGIITELSGAEKELVLPNIVKYFTISRNPNVQSE